MWCMVIALIGPTSFQWNREKFNEHLPLSSRQYVPLVASERCGKWWVSIWESISLAILEFLKKKERESEREKEIQSRSALEGWSRFLRFRNKLQNLWTISTYTDVEPCQATYSAPLDRFFPFSFLLFYRKLIVSDVRAIFYQSWFYLSISQSPNLSMVTMMRRDLFFFFFFFFFFFSPFFHVVPTVNNALRVNRALKKV